MAAFSASAHQRPFNVTLAWDPSPDGSVAGYRLYDGIASGIYANVIDLGNATNATVSNLVSGVTYFFAATAYDTNGQESVFSDEVSYTVPWPTNAPPALVLTLPADGAVYTAPATINFTADVTPNGHTIIQVGFYSGIKPVGTVTSAPYSFSWTNVGAGSYSLSARVVYDSGSMLASAAVNVTVGAVQPPSGLTFVPDSGTISPPFTGTLTWDPSPDPAIAGYIYEVIASGAYTNVIDVGTATIASVSNLSNGVTYFFAVLAYDTNGPLSDFSDAISYTVPWSTNDPPIVALTLPADGAVYIAPATINFTADVKPNGHIINQVGFYNGIKPLSSVTSVPYSFSWPNVRTGTYSLRAKVVYDFGITVASVTVNVTVVAGPPPSGLTFSADSGNNSLPFSGSLAWDPSPASDVAGYRLYDGIASGTYTNVIDVGNATNATVSNLVSGVTYFFAATAYYTHGQESVFSNEINYTVPRLTNTPPTLTLTAPANGAVYVTPATINLAADLMPNGHTISQVRFYTGTNCLGAVSSAPYSFSWQNVSVGTYSLSAQLFDDSGSTLASAPVNVTVSPRKIGPGSDQPGSFYPLQLQ
jgi:hypothetical protein